MPLRSSDRVSYLPITVLVGFCLLFMVMPASAQDERPAPQFLYRDENHLVLLNGYTGESTQLPFEVSDQDRFEWSPDGQYLLAQLHESGVYRHCLNLYDVDAQKWLHEKPISCSVGEAIFYEGGKMIIYTSSDEMSGALWLYSIANNQSQKLYQTTGGDKTTPNYIAHLQWSPTKTYLTFVDYLVLTGGTINAFVIMDVKNQDHFTLNGGGYGVSFHPIWSKDDRWFLIVSKENFITSRQLPHYKGDVYLVNPETDDQYRLTYTPAIYESNIRWTDDGKIAFDVATVHVEEFIYTPEQAAQIDVVPDDEIITPEPINEEEYVFDPMSDLIMSPDPNIAAWVSSKPSENTREKDIWELKIGLYNYSSESPTASFSVRISESYRYGNVLIGWRPSNYDYGGIG